MRRLAFCTKRPGNGAGVRLELGRVSDRSKYLDFILEGRLQNAHQFRPSSFVSIVTTLAIGIAFALASRFATGQSSDWKDVETALGRSGQVQPGDVIRIAMPRKDLHVMLDGVEIKPALALGSWVAFKRAGTSAMVMGDLVLTEEEVGPVMMKLQEGGVQESAVHNHLLGEQPHVMYMHIAAHGDAAQMAKSIHEALALTQTPGPDAAPSSQPAAELGFEQKQVEQILGHRGKSTEGFSNRSTPSGTNHRCRHAVPPAMGVATALNFQPTGNGKAAITGDFVLLGKEVNPVIKALRQNGIAVTALHSHMLMEEPRTVLHALLGE